MVSGERQGFRNRSSVEIFNAAAGFSLRLLLDNSSRLSEPWRLEIVAMQHGYAFSHYVVVRGGAGVESSSD